MNELFFRLGNTPSVAAIKALLACTKSHQSLNSVIKELPHRTIRERLNIEIVSAEATLQKPATAIEHMRRAVELATPNGHRQIFLNRTPEFQSIFLQFAQSHPSVYVEQLVGLMRSKLNISNLSTPGLDHPLTKRELDILRRLSSGLPISQIAAGIHISNNTIKTHLKNVYKKLGVDSREAAVAKGRELLLLS